MCVLLVSLRVFLVDSVVSAQLGRLFGVEAPWFVKGLRFDGERRTVMVEVDFERGTRFAHERAAGSHPVHDTRRALYRHVDACGWRCHLDARMPRVKLPDGKVAMVRPPWQGLLGRETLAFEAEVLRQCVDKPFAAVGIDVAQGAGGGGGVCGAGVAVAGFVGCSAGVGGRDVDAQGS